MEAVATSKEGVHLVSGGFRGKPWEWPEGKRASGTILCIR